VDQSGPIGEPPAGVGSTALSNQDSATPATESTSVIQDAAGARVPGAKARRDKAGITHPEDGESAAAPADRDPKEPGARLERIGERTEDFVDTVESAITQAVPQRVRHRSNPRQNTIVNVTWRALVLVAGMSLIAVRVLLLVLPGPGWATILLGLVVLASEYTWANRLLEPVRRRVRREAKRVRGLSPRRQVAVYAGLAACTIGFLVLSWYAVTHMDLSWLP